MGKNKGLGRGLDALLAGGEEASSSVGGAMALPIEQLQPGKYQPRTHMDQESLEQLASSIKAQGIVQPILVRALQETGRYEIIAGERRWRAARMAGLTEVPVVEKNIPDEAALAISLIENIQRENLNPLEEAQGIQRLVKEFGMTHQAAAEAVGRSRSAVSNLLRLLNLAPPVQEQLLRNEIDMGHARAILSLDIAKQTEAAREITRRGLSVREAEKLAHKMQANAAPRKIVKNQDVARLEEDLAEKLGAIVNIRPKGDKGSLVIHYDSLEQLDGLIAILSAGHAA
jgi:ParB family chromosome partitioning protein